MSSETTKNRPSCCVTAVSVRHRGTLRTFVGFYPLPSGEPAPQHGAQHATAGFRTDGAATPVRAPLPRDLGSAALTPIRSAGPCDRSPLRLSPGPAQRCRWSGGRGAAAIAPAGPTPLGRVLPGCLALGKATAWGEPARHRFGCEKTATAPSEARFGPLWPPAPAARVIRSAGTPGLSPRLGPVAGRTT
jgi:hypothetical protein